MRKHRKCFRLGGLIRSWIMILEHEIHLNGSQNLSDRFPRVFPEEAAW